jgi:hypothetical protein
MWTRNRLVVAAIVVLLVSWVAPSFAQQAAPKAEVASGELVRVDTSAKTISIRAEGGNAMVFGYTDATKVTGGENVAGLASMAGTSVSVHYTKQGQNNVASEIVVQKKAS